MRIIEEEQLDFDDLLICPQNSTILSRSDVNIEREIKWYNKDNTKKFSLSFIPVGTSNMGTVGTCNFAKKMVLSNHIACLEKHIDKNEIENLLNELTKIAESEGKDGNYYKDKVILSIGIREELDNIKYFYDKFNIKMIMIDSPNGYIPSLIKRIEDIHNYCVNSFIIAGNVVDSSGAVEILRAGAKCVKVGIGNGSCFVGRTLIKTENGIKQIKDISLGEKVLTHTGEFKKVINKFEFSDREQLIKINDIECTPDHKFFVIDKIYASEINDDNYLKYGKWVEAKDIDIGKHLLIEIK